MKKRSLRALCAILAALIVACMAPASLATVLPGMTSKVDYTNVDPDRYIIEIDLTNQVITVYESNDGSIVLRSLCTTGNDENPTGAGVYKLGPLKERFGYFVAYGQYAQYWSQVVRGIYIHSIMYDTTKLSSMSKSAFRGLGSALSHGCVRVLPHVAQWIYYNCPPETTCKVTANIAKNTALTKSLKSEIGSYSDYVQPTDDRSAPPVIPATVRFDNVPLRTGFSTTKDTTVATLNSGDHVDLLQLGSEWVKARTQSGKLGYILTRYVLCYPDSFNFSTSAYTSSAKTFVYADTDVDSEQLATIPKGAVVAVEDNPVKGWYSGAYDGVSGYMRTKYVKKTTVYSYPELAVAADGTTEHMAMVRSDIIANFRDKPTTSGSSVLAALQPSSILYVINSEGSWYYARYGELYGYISAGCVTLF